MVTTSSQLPPAPSNFLGRDEQIQTLKQWIIEESCPVVSIWGMAGMGKTALAVKLAETQEIKDKFDYRIGRSLENAPPLNELIQYIIQVLSDGQESSVPEERNPKIELLRKYLREKRCLIIIDNLEGIWKEDQPSKFREGYEDYQNFLPDLIKGNNEGYRSCVLSTSRSKPPAVTELETRGLPVESLELKGLDTEDGKKIFEPFRPSECSDQEWQEVIEHYKGNPQALRIVAPLVQEFFQGNLSELINRFDKLPFNNLDDLIKRQYQRLSPLDKEIIRWLAIEREPVKLSDLEGDIFSHKTNQIVSDINRLVNDSMIDRRDSYYTLHPFIREYFTNKFVEEICNDIINYETILNDQESILNTHAIIKAQSKVYIKESQITYILKPIVEKLKKGLGDKKDIENHLRQLVLDLRGRLKRREGYAAGNILNILVKGLETDLKTKGKDYDFSNLTIWQAYLQECYLHGVNFSNSAFNNCVFGDIIDGVFSVAFSKVNYDIVDQYKQQQRTQLVAAGDLNGQYHIYGLQNFEKIAPKNPITSIGLIWSLAFHPTEKKLVTGSGDKTVLRIKLVSN